jgi:pimeloyl-ACP methyl ester carboxylesterase
MPELAKRGHNCFAVSLTGHGGSEGKLKGRSVKDHVEDVYSVVARFDTPPILVGHSMGGYVVQQYAAFGHPATGVALVAPVPPAGAWGATWRVARAHPGKLIKAILTADVGAVVEKPGHAYQWLFAPTFPRAEADRYVDQWERASYRTFIGMLFQHPDVSRIHVPVILVGGDQDALFTVAEWEKAADDLGTKLQVIEGGGHQLMLEPAWIQLADIIERFAKAFEGPGA